MTAPRTSFGLFSVAAALFCGTLSNTCLSYTAAGYTGGAQLTGANTKAAILLEEGTFERGLGPNGAPVGWTIQPGNYSSFKMNFELAKSEGNTFAKFTNGEITQNFRLISELDLPPGKKRTLRISARLRVSDFVQDPATDWASAQIGFEICNAVGSWDWRGTTPLRLQRNTKGWIEREVSFRIADDINGLRVMPGLYKATGTLEIDDIKVFVE